MCICQSIFVTTNIIVKIANKNKKNFFNFYGTFLILYRLMSIENNMKGEF
jgi:hypothetical protein